VKARRTTGPVVRSERGDRFAPRKQTRRAARGISEMGQFLPPAPQKKITGATPISSAPPLAPSLFQEDRQSM
jgi:hypothetical protein